jgi:hypothetical protein
MLMDFDDDFVDYAPWPLTNICDWLQQLVWPAAYGCDCACLLSQAYSVRRVRRGWKGIKSCDC